jgi:hypothetical protein
MAADVHGRFLTTVRVGVAERTIAVGDRQSATDPTGAFTLSGVPATYDLAVVDKDGARLALFLGLSRRDPVISDAEWQGGDRGALRRGAFISGHLAGAALPTPEGRLRATVQFFSVRQPLRRSDAGFFQRASYPGNIGRNPITWRGPPSISGRLLATIHVQGKRDDYPLVGIASKQLTFEDGDNVSEDLAAIPLTAGRIAGTWNPAANPQVASLSVAYQFSDGSGEFWVGACRLRDPAGRVLPVSPGASPIVNPVGEQPFSCPLPDVSMLPGRYRVFLVENYGSVLEPEREHLTTCTIQPGGAGPATPCEQATRDAPAPPDDTTTEQFTSPPHSQFTDIGRNFRFAWKPRKNAVYAIDLLPRKSFNLVPRISLYTRKTSFGWSDLAKYGIGFPTGAKYLASVRSIQVSSVDQVASLEWWYGRDSESARIAVQSSGVRLMDPAAPVADAKARSNVMDLESFPAGLPACASERKGEVLGARSLGRVVTITGKLGLTAGECIHLLSRGPAQNCASYWAITEVAGSSLPVSLVRTAGVARPSDGLRVAATGLFTLDADDQVPVLEQANLCVLPTRQ